MKCDIQKYFPSIDHTILLRLIERKVACSDTMGLIRTILGFPSIQIGIPIGNLTSQFFANIYLDGMDHYIKEKLRCRCYIRYMDDFVVFHDDKKILLTVKRAIEEHLKGLRLLLHEGKCRVYKTLDGVSFLGMVILPDHRRLKRGNVVRFKRRLRNFQELYWGNGNTWRHIYRSIQSWIGHASHADTGKLRDLILSDVIFRKGRED